MPFFSRRLLQPVLQHIYVGCLPPTYSQSCWQGSALSPFNSTYVHPLITQVLARCCWPQEVKGKRAANLCNNFAAGRCTYGEKCRFNHDTAAFLEQAAPALPGACPFRSLEQCPFGKPFSPAVLASSSAAAAERLSTRMTLCKPHRAVSQKQTFGPVVHLLEARRCLVLRT